MAMVRFSDRSLAPQLTMVKYGYDNADLVMQASISLYAGQVNYTSSVGIASGWHGLYRNLEHAQLELRFNCRGEGYPLRSAMLTRTEYGWHGHDYLNREIVLTKLCEYYLDPVSHMWVVYNNSGWTPC